MSTLAVSGPFDHVRHSLDGADSVDHATYVAQGAIHWRPEQPCAATTTGPAQLPCRLGDGHTGGHLFHGDHVRDRHSDDQEDPR